MQLQAVVFSGVKRDLNIKASILATLSKLTALKVRIIPPVPFFVKKEGKNKVNIDTCKYMKRA